MTDIHKEYIGPVQFREDSFLLASKVLRDGFKPDFMVALWRGGAPVGCYVHEFLKWKGVDADHIAIRTSKYTGIDKANEEVVVHNLTYIKEKLFDGAKVLVVDDVWDTGSTVMAFFEAMKGDCDIDIRVATVYFKPSRNQTSHSPEYYVRESENWLVFPHELEGMSIEEIEKALGYEIAQMLK